MSSYIFQLGRKSALSVAELSQVLREGGTVKEQNGEHVMIDLENDFPDAQGFLDSLGGTVKMSKVFATLEKNATLDAINEKLFAHIQATKPNISGKFTFAISAFNLSGKDKNFLKNLLKNLKNILKENGIGSRFLNNNLQNANNVAVWEENIIEKGIDINVVYGAKTLYLAETVALQNFKFYSDRDYGKPVRDSKKGMLPPKLAQIMINIAVGAKTEGVIYDPFCGSGTALLEAMLMGFDVIGSDIDPGSIAASEKNIGWLKSRLPVLENRQSLCFAADVTKVSASQIQNPEKITAIVAESWLGPALKGEASELQYHEISAELETLHTNMFENSKKLFKAGTPFVIAIPAFRMGKEIQYLRYFPALLEKFGIKTMQLPRDSASARESFLYDREDQFTLREIWALEL